MEHLTDDFGIDDFDDANIPVDISLVKEEDGVGFILTASNYMPRKSRVEVDVLNVKSDDKQELIAIVRDKFLPIYEAAVQALKDIVAEERKELYYWHSV